MLMLAGCSMDDASSSDIMMGDFRASSYLIVSRGSLVPRHRGSRHVLLLSRGTSMWTKRTIGGKKWREASSLPSSHC